MSVADMLTHGFRLMLLTPDKFQNDSDPICSICGAKTPGLHPTTIIKPGIKIVDECVNRCDEKIMTVILALIPDTMNAYEPERDRYYINSTRLVEYLGTFNRHYHPKGCDLCGTRLTRRQQKRLYGINVGGFIVLENCPRGCDINIMTIVKACLPKILTIIPRIFVHYADQMNCWSTDLRCQPSKKKGR